MNVNFLDTSESFGKNSLSTGEGPNISLPALGVPQGFFRTVKRTLGNNELKTDFTLLLPGVDFTTLNTPEDVEES